MYSQWRWQRCELSFQGAGARVGHVLQACPYVEPRAMAARDGTQLEKGREECGELAVLAGRRHGPRSPSPAVARSLVLLPSGCLTSGCLTCVFPSQ